MGEHLLQRDAGDGMRHRLEAQHHQRLMHGTNLPAEAEKGRIGDLDDARRQPDIRADRMRQQADIRFFLAHLNLDPGQDFRARRNADGADLPADAHLQFVAAAPCAWLAFVHHLRRFLSEPVSMPDDKKCRLPSQPQNAKKRAVRATQTALATERAGLT